MLTPRVTEISCLSAHRRVALEGRQQHVLELSEIVAVRVPTQSGLCSFQNQEFKPRMFVMHGHAPLFIVVGNVVLI